jgi:hypothetical protein
VLVTNQHSHLIWVDVETYKRHNWAIGLFAFSVGNVEVIPKTHELDLAFWVVSLVGPVVEDIVC